MSGLGQNSGKRGQALVMVTLALVTMCGMLGLAVDLGWAYFVEKTAQAAADAAALAAIHEALRVTGPANFSCGVVDCTPGASPSMPQPCSNYNANSPMTTLDYACYYAKENGFEDGGKNGRQSVTVAAQTTSPPDTLVGDPNRTPLEVYYWTTVRIREEIPQLFSAVLGKTMGVASSRATAAAADAVFTGSLLLLNRIGDPSPYPDVNLKSDGGNTIQADGPILLASGAAGPGNDPWAGEAGGNSTIIAPRTLIRGGYDASNNVIWNNTPVTGVPDGNEFKDPLRGTPDPPPPLMAATAANSFPIGYQVLKGYNTLAEAIANPNPPGFYYATGCPPAAPNKCSDGILYPTGDPLKVPAGQYVAFSSPNGTDFGEYVFFGGLEVPVDAHVHLDSGQYVFAGTKDGNKVFQVANKGQVTDNATSDPGETGELLVFTQPDYLRQDQIPYDFGTPIGQTAYNSLTFGGVEVHAGHVDSIVQLHGLSDGKAPAHLEDYESLVFWQDRRNSSVIHAADGTLAAACYSEPVDPSCIRAGAFGNNQQINAPPVMQLEAGPGLDLWGVVYQPRGAWIEIQATADYEGPIQVVSGGLSIAGTASVDLLGLDNPITIKTVALVE